MNTLRFGSYIKDKRNELKKTRAEFASMVGISESYLYHIETGIKVPSAENMLDIAKALNVRSGYLLELLDDRNTAVYLPEIDSLQMAVEPQYQQWITVENIQQVSPYARRHIAAIIKEERYEATIRRSVEAEKLKRSRESMANPQSKEVVLYNNLYELPPRQGNLNKVIFHLYLVRERTSDKCTVVLTEVPENVGESITNGIERIAYELTMKFVLNPRNTIWYERYDTDYKASTHAPAGLLADMEIKLEWRGDRYTNPQWISLNDHSYEKELEAEVNRQMQEERETSELRQKLWEESKAAKMIDNLQQSQIEEWERQQKEQGQDKQAG
jgi:transcriptional regulator with XRE-family HTH domain